MGIEVKKLGASNSSLGVPLKVVIGKLARLGIEVQLRTDVVAGAHEALLYYVRKLDSGQPPLAPPRFLRDQPPDGAAVVLELAVDAETQAALEREASRQRIPLSQVLAHAVFVYLADLEAASEGRSLGDEPSASRSLAPVVPDLEKRS